MKNRILLNGAGRIGKAILKQIINNKYFEIACINDTNPYIENLVYSINYDSTYGKLDDKFRIIDENYIQNSSTKIKITHFDTLYKVDLSNIDIVIDSSGKREDINKLRELDVKAIFLTHPNKNADINIILGVNECKLDINIHKVISTSSCNATSLLPALNIIDKNKNIILGDVVTIHPLLNHQRVLDGHYVKSDTRDINFNFEFGRSSNFNIIPSNTTTIKACSYVLEKFNDNLISSSSFRVPIDTVGSMNVVLFTKDKSNKKEIIDLFSNYENNQKFPIVLNNYEHLVSSDFKKEKHTCIIDHRYLDVKENMIKLVIWHDNEWGYASKVCDILKYYVKNKDKK